jgi:hypothetical protein
MTAQEKVAVREDCATSERETLKKFINGKKVESNEYSVIENYSKIGVTKLGFSFTKKEIQASLTKSGKRILGIKE